MELFTILLIPAIVAALSLIRDKKGNLAAGATIIGTLATFLLSLHRAFGSGLGAEGGKAMALPGWLSCDGLSALIVLLVSFVGFTASLFSWGYMGRATNEGDVHRVRRYYRRYNLFLVSMLAVPLLSHVAFVWIAVELTTLLSVFLVGFEDSPEALEAAWKYVVLTCMGAALALIGVLILYWGLRISGAEQFTWPGLVLAAPKIPSVFLKIAFFFILTGFGTKAGLVPLHTWLPDAHSQAPSPVCALLSGVETTTALYVVLRLLPVLGGAPGSAATTWFVTFGLISVGAAAFLIMQVKDFKRLFAFSTIEHMGIILVAAGLGGGAAHLGAVYQIMTHAVTKSFCFFAAGSVLLLTGTRDIGSVRGLIRVSPIAGAALMIGGLAIAGAPPFGVFLSEFAIIKAGFAGGHYAIIGTLTLLIAIAFCGMMFHINRMVFGRASQAPGVSNLPASCSWALGLAIIPVVVLGFSLPSPLHHILQLAAGTFAR
jgi:hydrogenase-4 component F